MEELNKNKSENVEDFESKTTLADVDEQVKKGKSKKKKIISVIFFFVNILIIVGILSYNLFSEDIAKLTLVDNINTLYFVLCIALIILVLVLDVAIVTALVFKSIKKFKPWLSFKSFIQMRYYDNITPMSVGGQSFMISYLVNRGVPGSKALSIPMKKFILQQLSWSVICLCGLIASIAMPSVEIPAAVYVFATIGFIINFGLIMFLFFGSTSKRMVLAVAVFGLNLLKKMHIVKNYDKWLDKCKKFVSEYQQTMKEFSKSKFEFVTLAFVNLVKNLLYFSIPFLICCIFTTPDINLFWQVFVYTVIIELASSCCPLPGGSGMNEITFNVLFALILEGNVFWALLIWRFASYYMWLILGLFVLIIDFVCGHRKAKKEQLVQQTIEKENKDIG